MNTYICICIYKYTCIYVYVYIYTCIHTQTHKHTHTSTHTHTHAHTHTHTHTHTHHTHTHCTHTHTPHTCISNPACPLSGAPAGTECTAEACTTPFPNNASSSWPLAGILGRVPLRSVMPPLTLASLVELLSLHIQTALGLTDLGSVSDLFSKGDRHKHK